MQVCGTRHWKTKRHIQPCKLTETESVWWTDIAHFTARSSVAVAFRVRVRSLCISVTATDRQRDRQTRRQTFLWLAKAPATDTLYLAHSSQFALSRLLQPATCEVEMGWITELGHGQNETTADCIRCRCVVTWWSSEATARVPLVLRTVITRWRHRAPVITVINIIIVVVVVVASFTVREVRWTMTVAARRRLSAWLRRTPLTAWRHYTASPNNLQLQ